LTAVYNKKELRFLIKLKKFQQVYETVNATLLWKWQEQVKRYGKAVPVTDRGGA
jgi:hypothetical protein